MEERIKAACCKRSGMPGGCSFNGGVTGNMPLDQRLEGGEN